MPRQSIGASDLIIGAPRLSIEVYHKSTEAPPRQSSHLPIGLILSAITRHTAHGVALLSLLCRAVRVSMLPEESRAALDSKFIWTGASESIVVVVACLLDIPYLALRSIAQES